MTVTDGWTVDDGVADVPHGSFDWSLDRIRNEGVVVRGGPISRPLDRPLHHVGDHGIIAILN
jgi:hypothetical protein